MAYTLLALDMDGTLLDSRKRVSEGTRKALERLAARGVSLAYCTGRCILELLDHPKELPFVRYGVLASGAVVYDLVADEALAVRPLDTQTVLGAMEVARGERCMTHVMGIRESVVRPSDLREMPRYGMGVYQSMFEDICTRAEDLAQWVGEHPGQVVKVNFYHESPQARDRTRARLVEAGLPLTLANAEERSVECSPLGVSKGEGLRVLAEHLGTTLADVVAIGDSDNDAAALRAVGMPVAMGNASPEVMGMARLVVADNDHDGIAEAIDRLW